MTQLHSINCKIHDNEIVIRIFSQNELNFNTPLMETLCQNRELFQNLHDIESIKLIIDLVCQHTVEEVAIGFGDYGRIGRHKLNKREKYLLTQNDKGQNILHLAINVFKNFPNRMAIVFTLLEVLKGYLTYPSWYHMCFVQRNSTGIRNVGYTVFQNLYYLRYPMIIGPFDNNNKNYSTGQKCIEALSVYQNWQYNQNMTPEQRQKENLFLRKLHVVQFALQQICRTQTRTQVQAQAQMQAQPQVQMQTQMQMQAQPANNYLITIWQYSSQTFFDTLLGESDTPVFHFHDELEPLNVVLDEILEKLFAPNSEFMMKIDVSDKREAINYAFDKNKTMVSIICDVVKEVVQSRQYQIPETIKQNVQVQNAVQNAVQVQNQHEEQAQELEIVVEDSSDDPELEELVRGDVPVVQVKPNEQRIEQTAYLPKITINQISNVPINEKFIEDRIKTFTKDIDAILKMFEQNGKELMQPDPNERDPKVMVDIAAFLIWLSSPSSNLTWKEMQTIFDDDGVVFSLRVWMQEAIDQDTKWIIPIPDNFKHQNIRGQTYIFVNVFGFLIYIGIPLVLLTKALSTKNCTGEDFAMKLCSNTFVRHFNLLNRSHFLLNENDPTGPSLAYLMLLVDKKYRNVQIDRLNVEFLLYFANPNNGEFKFDRANQQANQQANQNQRRNQRQRGDRLNYNQMLVNTYIKNDLQHSEVVQKHFKDGCHLTFADIDQEIFEETKSECQAYIDKWNEEMNGLVRMSIPNENFIKQALLDEQILEVLKDRIQIIRIDENYTHLYMNITFRINYKNNRNIRNNTNKNMNNNTNNNNRE